MTAESLGGRVIWSLAGATLLFWAFLLTGYSDSYPWLSAIGIVIGLAGLAILAVAWFHRGAEFPIRLGWAALVIGIVALALWCWIQIRIGPAYGTDESAFDQYAAQLVLHGHNPYQSSMSPSFGIFHVNPNGYTFRLNGTPETTLSYPALSFLIYVPLLFLHLKTQLAISMNVAAWAISIILGYFLLPRNVKPAAIVLGSLGIYTGFAVGGVTDMLYVPLLIVAVFQWDRALQRRGWKAWISPVALGLAASIKQTPWFVIPFVVIGLYLDLTQQGQLSSRAVASVWSYVWKMLLAFFLVNVVFIVASPIAWFKGVLTPFIGGLVPAGQGWIALSNFLGFGGGALWTYSFLVGGAVLASLVLFIVTYPRSKSIAIFIPSFILFFSARSFASYFVMMLLPAVIAACSIRTDGAENVRLNQSLLGTRNRVIAGALALVVFAGALIAVAAVPQPIGLRIESVETTGQLATVIEVTAVVSNSSRKVLRPTFSSESGGAITAPWSITSGPNRLEPGQIATYELQAPNFEAQPSLSGGFQMVALTSSPAAMSVSPPYDPTIWHVLLNPQAVNKPVNVDEPITIKAEVLNTFDGPVREAGVRVYLGQISYTQQGLLFTQAIINKGQIGETPVKALTNANGVATFTITGTKASLNPVYFEANLINASALYPYGYSNIVPIRFVTQ